MRRVVRVLRSPRALAASVPAVMLALLMVGGAAGQESPSPSTSPGPMPSPEPLPSGSVSEPVPIVTLRPIDIGTPRPDSNPSPLPIFTLDPRPSALPEPIPAPTPIIHPGDGQTNTCYACHVAIDDVQKEISDQWQESVHGKALIGCADCHGGDPTSKSVTVAMSADAAYLGVPDRRQSVGICGGCHADTERMKSYGLPTDMFAKYQTSVHGLRLYTDADTRVAICTDCHGVHDTKKASDPTSLVSPLNVPELCASCHSDPDVMGPYGIPTDQLERYKESIHGQTLLEAQDIRAPTCASCHGSHGAAPPNTEEVVNVCGRCHTATQQLYQESRHAVLLDAAPKCATCHGSHDVVRATEERFFHLETPEYECLTCHDPTDRSVKLRDARFVNDADRRCDTCHHPQSLIMSQIEAIHDSVSQAADAFDGAEVRIRDAAQLGMIVVDAEAVLTLARTDLIRARAAVHTTNLTTIDELAKGALAKSEEASAIADAKIGESVFRRQAMVVIVGLLLINAFGLFLYKRQLDRRLHEGDHEAGDRPGPG